jgi:polyhydroxyalkanoate synthesis repressor PhaR
MVMPPRLIKKYPNRRLYDTHKSCYITLADLRQLILAGHDVQVIDSASEEEITRSILLQIITESEAGGEPLFNTTMLTQLIRFYGGTVQGLFARYMEQSLNLFAQQQGGSQPNPLDALSKMTENNLRIWGDMQQELLRQWQRGGGDEGKDR